MKGKLIALLVSSGLLWHPAASADVVEYIDCEVRDAGALIAANAAFYEAMAGGLRPVVSIDANLWNGESRVTHTILVIHEDHQSLETAMNRIDQNMGAYLQLLNTINNVADCSAEGLAVELDSWGDREPLYDFYAVYPSYVTDPARYGRAFSELAEAIIADAPGRIALYQNRAGLADTTHFVVFFSPTLTALNEFLDEVTASDAYADFVDEVMSIRTLGSASQSRRVQTWTP